MKYNPPIHDNHDIESVDLIGRIDAVNVAKESLLFTSGADGHTVALLMDIIATLPDDIKDKIRHVHGHKGNIAIVGDILHVGEAEMIASLGRDHSVVSVEVYSTDLGLLAIGLDHRIRIVGGYQWG